MPLILLFCNMSGIVTPTCLNDDYIISCWIKPILFEHCFHLLTALFQKPEIHEKEISHLARYNENVNGFS